MEGNIVVDGVLASCYGIFDHDLGHIAMTPMRWFPRMMNWMFGSESEVHGSLEMAMYIGYLTNPLKSTNDQLNQ